MDILIDECTWQWNHSVIDGLVAPHEDEIIKKIPLARVASKDVLYWPLSSNGKYTFKIGYRFLKEEESLSPLDLAKPNDKNLWKGVWSLQTPNKVKNLMRRACRNSLSTKQNLV